MDRTTLKSWFQRGKKPTASQFAALIDSFWHKDDTMSLHSIKGLNEALQTKAGINHDHDEVYSATGHTHDQYLTEHQDITGKADKVVGAVAGNLATLDANGNPIDSGKKTADFAPAEHNHDEVYSAIGHTHDQYLTEHQDISGKQDKTDTTLQTADKTVVGAINEIWGTLKELWNRMTDYLKGIYHVTWEELKELRDTGKLVPGHHYRITDYVTTIANDPEARSAGHPFDIIVLATATDTLSEEAHAIRSARDTDNYFADANLNAWKLWYCLDNDNTRFAFANKDGIPSYPQDATIQFVWRTKDITADTNVSFNLYHETNGNLFAMENGEDDLYASELFEGDNHVFYAATLRELLDEGMDMSSLISFGVKVIDDGLWNEGSYIEIRCNDAIVGTIMANGSPYTSQAYDLATLFDPSKQLQLGKGVIYRMIDEWSNDCPYDFKNVQFKRYRVIDVSANGELSELDGKYYGYNDYMTNLEIEDENDFVWAYTFSSVDDDGNWLDYSLKREDAIYTESEFGDWGYLHQFKKGRCEYNLIRHCYAAVTIDDACYRALALNNIVLISTIDELCGLYGEMLLNEFGTGNYNMTVKDNPEKNAFGNKCYNNIVGSYGNTFGNYFQRNTFGNGCDSNTFGNGCSWNTFGNGCDSNTFGNYFQRNTFGNYFQRNTFGNGCDSNTFGNGCDSNTFGNGCEGNTFGNYFQRNTFGNGCSWNTFGNYFQRNTFGNNCRYITVHNGVQYVSITGGSTDSSYVQNAQILNGTRGSDTSNKLQISFQEGADYCQYAGLNSSGDLRIWTPADTA